MWEQVPSRTQDTLITTCRCTYSGRLNKIGDFPSQPIIQDHLGNCVQIRFVTLVTKQNNINSWKGVIHITLRRSKCTHTSPISMTTYSINLDYKLTHYNSTHYKGKHKHLMRKAYTKHHHVHDHTYSLHDHTYSVCGHTSTDHTHSTGHAPTTTPTLYTTTPDSPSVASWSWWQAETGSPQHHTTE